MLTIRRCVAAIRRWFSGDRPERDLCNEVQSYAQLLEDEARAAGVPEGEARRRALAELGGVESVKESVRESRAGAVIEQILQDARYAVRGLRRTPAFAATAVFMLGCGIGLSTAVFAVLNASILKPLPYVHPEQLVELGHTIGAGTAEASTYFGVTWQEIRFWREQKRLFAGVEARDFTDPVALWRENGTELQLGRFTAGLPALLGVNPLMGRSFTPSESESAAPVLVLSEELWTRRFARRPSVLGEVVTLGAVPFTVIGVMPASFRYGPPGGGLMDAWSGLPERVVGSATRSRFSIAVARLQSELSVPAANAIAIGMASGAQAAIGPLPPPYDTPWEPRLSTLDDWRMRVAKDSTLSPLLLLIGTGGLVLVIACANVANLLSARGAARREELRLRSALGASRNRLIHLLLVEGLVVTALSAALGIFVSQAAVRAAIALMPMGMSRSLFEAGYPAVDWRVLVFVLSMGAAVALLASLWPAVAQSRVRLSASGASRVAGSTTGRRSGAWLQSLQVALALILAIGSGLLARSLQAAVTTDIGFDPQRLYAMTVILPNGRYMQSGAKEVAADALVDAVTRLPGSLRASIGPSPGAVSTSYYFEAEGQPAIRRFPTSTHWRVGGDYFETAGIHLIEGRAFGQQDVQAASRVVIVDDAMAKWLSPDGHVLGRRLRLSSRQPFTTIVGIVNDTRTADFTREGPRPGLYYPWLQEPATYVPIILRSAANESQLRNSIETAVRSVDPDARIFSFESAAQAFVRADTYQRPLFIAALVSLFAALALLTAAVGLFSLLSYSVGRRQREIGVRVALGSTAGQIRRLVVREALRPVITGVTIGLGAAWLLMRYLASYFYGVDARDPITFAASAWVLIGAALLATIGPIRRATSVDPMRSLRSE